MRVVNSVLFILPVLLGLGACTNDRAVSPTAPQEECLTRPAATDGRPIAGQYIITYQEAPGGAPSVATGRAGDRIAALLNRHGITRDVVLTHFAGRTQGFCGKLSAAAAAKLAGG
jgi:hypothetical protein